MRLPRVDSAINVCAEHIQKSSAAGTEIESYLTQHLLVFMCAAFEEHIEDLVHARVGKSGDAAIASFARSATSQLFRSLKTTEIAGLLGRFGKESKERFQDEMKRNQRAETFFNNIVTNRHEVAHLAGCNVTFPEIVQFYEEGHAVLDAIRTVLEMSEP